MRTSVIPKGDFVYGIHKPSYTVRNLRDRTRLETLGSDYQGFPIDNRRNYPEDEVEVQQADWIYEIANPLPFRGTTFIGKAWADRSAEDYDRIRLPAGPEVSMSQLLAAHGLADEFFGELPRPVLLGLATTSTDPDDLVRLAHISCSFVTDDNGNIGGLRYLPARAGNYRADIADPALFEAVANNRWLPDRYKIAMVIRPGAQGASEIVGDYHQGRETHIYEYLRRNSYIGGGHYAANMADDAIRYAIGHLSAIDFNGLRHLYYQRSYFRLAAELGLDPGQQQLDVRELEQLRRQILDRLADRGLESSATLWGWNFGFDYAPSDYRLHASHQQIHQQYALIPDRIDRYSSSAIGATGSFRPFSAGDMVTEVIEDYRRLHDREFFVDYLRAITTNNRMDSRTDRERSLVIWEDERAVLFVPKAQTSQWELQLMSKPGPDRRWPGNILETDSKTRESLDTGLLKAQQCLERRGARMVTTIELPKRFTSPIVSQPLLYCLMPKLPQSPGAFSETQLRFINGHYPEDFAAACRRELVEDS